MKTCCVEKITRQRSLLQSLESVPGMSQKCRKILLISGDRKFHQKLLLSAHRIGVLVVRAEKTVGTVAILEATRPDLVLLDLDLPNQSAWPIAELVLNEPGCPALILLTRRTAQFDTRAVKLAGPVVNKGASLETIFRSIGHTLAIAQPNQSERNAIQRVLIQRLRPSGWAGSNSNTPAYRFWEINE